MGDLPKFAPLLGKSTLFDSGETDAAEAMPAGQVLDELVSDNECGGIRTFVTSKGKVFKLRKKRQGNVAGLIEQRLFGTNDSRAIWRGDESYGINISALIEKVEAQRPSKKDKEPGEVQTKSVGDETQDEAQEKNQSDKTQDASNQDKVQENIQVEKNQNSIQKNGQDKVQTDEKQDETESQKIQGDEVNKVRTDESQDQVQDEVHDGKVQEKVHDKVEDKVQDKAQDDNVLEKAQSDNVKDKLEDDKIEVEGDMSRDKLEEKAQDKVQGDKMKNTAQSDKKQDKVQGDQKQDKAKGKNAQDNSKDKLKKKVPEAKIRIVDKLWVEKWSPRKFLDLVGNEKTNRRVLRWIRQWSACTFNEQLPEMTTNISEQEIVDPLQRPLKRILLIHGPPGIGKTSVAHVAAKQAGYSVAEINASDERGGALVRDKVHNTLFNKQVLNAKPVCLIADEIDGSIESGFVRILLDILNKDNQATQRHMLGPNVNGKKKSKKARLLLRPIIAICNNLYAPALEKLKPHCEIVAVKRPADTSLLERLQDICKAEGLNVSAKALKELMHIAQGDVRNCVNNLQFLSTREDFRTGDLNDNPLDSVSKDMSQSWFRICNQIFRRDPHKELQQQLQEKTELVELNGNSEKVLQGCHSLYPHVKYSDNGVQKPAMIADWLYYHDLMFKSLFEHNGELLRYTSVVPLAFFTLFGDVANREDLRIQNAEYEVRELQRSNKDILKLMLHKLSIQAPSIVPFTSLESLALEVLPNLDYMLSSDMSKCREPKSKQAVYDILTELLKCFQLQLIEKPRENLNSKNALFIEPPINDIVVLDTQRQREVLTKRPLALDVLQAKVEESNAKRRHIKKVKDDRARNEEIKSNEIKTRKSGVSMADFFKSQYKVDGSAENGSNANDKSQSSAKTDSAFRIWVKYKEGFSDAVRKNVSWHDLWS